MVGWYHGLNGHEFEQTPGDLPDPGIETVSLTSPALTGWFFTTSATREAPEFGQTQGDNEGQGSLACCSPWGCKELDMTDN